MDAMPKPNQFILNFPNLTDYGTSYYCEPDNWAEIELGLSRKDYRVEKEITTEFQFSGTAGKIIKLLYETYGQRASMTLTFNKRQNDWSYLLFHTFTADFSTYSFDTKAYITFTENTAVKLIDDNKSVDYTFTIPQSGTYQRVLNYSGVERNIINTFKPIEAELSTFGNYGYKLKGTRITSAYTPYFEFSASNEIDIKCLLAKTPTISVRLGALTISIEKNKAEVISFADIRLYKLSGIVLTLIRTWHYNDVYYEDIDATTERTYFIFSNGTTYSHDISMIAGDVIFLSFMTSNDSSSNMPSIYEGTTVMTISSIDPSLYQAEMINTVTHEWLIQNILDQICPDINLVYNLPVNVSGVNFTTLLTSASALTKQTTQIITCSFEKVMKSLKCIYGADYRITGDYQTGYTLTVDYANTFFNNTKAKTVIPINEPKFSSNNDHVYNTVTVGYDTDDNVDNGLSEFNCLNKFKLSDIGTKELDLKHPFKGSMYTIEQFMSDKTTNSTKTKDKDTDIFIFAVGYYETIATLYRDTSSPDLPATAYNKPISPMHMLIANAAYLGISTYLTTPQAVFLSTDRLADLETTCSFDSSNISENYGLDDSPLGIAMATPLFLPETVELQTGFKMWTLSDINDNLYNYFEFTDLKTNLTHKFYINDFTLKLTEIDSQTWIGIVK